MYDLSSETCFLPAVNSEYMDEVRDTADKYNFITESFFMTQKAIDLGYRVAVDRIMKMSHVNRVVFSRDSSLILVIFQEISRLERAYRDAVQQSGHNSDVATSMHDRLVSQLTKLVN